MFRKNRNARCSVGEPVRTGMSTTREVHSRAAKSQVRTELMVEDGANGGRFSRTAAFTEAVHVLSAVRCRWRSRYNKQMLWYTTGCRFGGYTSPAAADKAGWFMGGLSLLRVTPRWPPRGAGTARGCEKLQWWRLFEGRSYFDTWNKESLTTVTRFQNTAIVPDAIVRNYSYLQFQATFMIIL